jgi:hypothetical protein
MMHRLIPYILAQVAAVAQPLLGGIESMSHKATKLGLGLSLSAALLVFALVVLFPSTKSRGQEPQLPPERVQLLSGIPMRIAAKEQGISVLAGKDISQAGGSPGSAKAKKLEDVEIGDDETRTENQPTVASNPRDKKNLVAGTHLAFPLTPSTNRCVAYRSSDNGATWSAPFTMPQLSPSSACADPVLDYAPDGSRVYYVYMDIKPNNDWDIVVSFSDNDGQSWTGPIIVLDAQPGFLYDKPWISAHIDRGESDWVYVTATQFSTVPGGTDRIAFTRSPNQAVTWSNPPTFLDSASSPVVVQGARPIGGLGGEVLVAWYNSGSDGWLSGSFSIRTSRSGDHGATFDQPVNAVTDNSELPFWLGPNAEYHRWWGGMFPDVEIGPKGEAFIVYTHDPVAGSTTDEDGDIRFISSVNAPYNVWSSPITISDDGSGKAQGYVTLEVGNGGQLHAMWEDHRLSSESNLFYDCFYSRKPRGTGFFSNFRVSDASSMSDFIYIGDYMDITSNNTTLFGIWTDRRDKLSILDFEDDVYGRIIAGGATP